MTVCLAGRQSSAAAPIGVGVDHSPGLVADEVAQAGPGGRIPGIRAAL